MRRLMFGPDSVWKLNIGSGTQTQLSTADYSWPDSPEVSRPYSVGAAFAWRILRLGGPGASSSVRFSAVREDCVYLDATPYGDRSVRAGERITDEQTARRR